MRLYISKQNLPSLLDFVRILGLKPEAAQEHEMAFFHYCAWCLLLFNSVFQGSDQNNAASSTSFTFPNYGK